MRVPIPDAIGAGVLDLRDYGEGLVAVAVDEQGTRYVEVSETTASYVRDDWERAGYEYAPADEPELDDNGVDDGSPYRDRETVDNGGCGYYDADTMESPCSRPAGWGRDADDGPCRDHVTEAE